jgi:hypothetical protein
MFYFKLYFLISVVSLPCFIAGIMCNHYKCHKSIRLAIANLTLGDLAFFMIGPFFWPLFLLGLLCWFLEKIKDIAEYRPFKFLEKAGKK